MEEVPAQSSCTDFDTDDSTGCRRVGTASLEQYLGAARDAGCL